MTRLIYNSWSRFSILPKVERTNHLRIEPVEDAAAVAVGILLEPTCVSFALAVLPRAGLDGTPVLGLEVTLDRLAIVEKLDKCLADPREAVEG